MFHRYVCSALEEMRAALEAIKDHSDPNLAVTRRHLASLIEEVQTGVNRMEKTLQQNKDIEYMEDRYHELKKEIKTLKKEKKQLKPEGSNDSIGASLDEYDDMVFDL